MAAPQHPHHIFSDIRRSDLGAVQQRVLADEALLEERERESEGWRTPLMLAIHTNKPSIAMWLIQHWGQHGVNAADAWGWSAVHRASRLGQLEVVQALVAAA